MNVPGIRGWCPTAHRPMMSGDGLLVRLRPGSGRMTAATARTVADLAHRFGNGLIDLTSRAGLQIRGVKDDAHSDLLRALVAAELVDADPDMEARRNIVVAPFWIAGDLTDRLAHALAQRLAELPHLPAKSGIAIDTGAAPVLQDVSSDFRFERDGEGGLLLRADGTERGWRIDEADAFDALNEMAAWFVKTGGGESRRMKRHVSKVSLPGNWQLAVPSEGGDLWLPGRTKEGVVVGVPFGAMSVDALAGLLAEADPGCVQVMPRRCLYLETARPVAHPAFIHDPSAFLLDVSACPGAPRCARATVPTRPIARQLAERGLGTLHVSGCAKGCARSGSADVTLVGRDGMFDLVRCGSVGDTPDRTGVPEAGLLELLR
ncbi:MAG: cobalamin biosynthesis protein CobG [Boseongicola sp.]|nr:cobalamin biosynthesis protein CobG [Boseongicola sp.]